MAIGTFTLYNTGKEALLTDNAGSIDWAADTVVAVLLSNTYTPALTHSTFADISATQISDVGYAPVALTGKSSVRASGVITFDCDNISYGSSVTIAAKYLVVVKRAAGALASTDQLIGYIDLNTDSTSAVASSTTASFAINTPTGLFDVQ